MRGERHATGQMECRYRCKDGHYEWIEFRGVNLVHDPDIRGLLGNYRNITERKRAERDLSESKAITEAIVEHMPLMVFLKEATDLRFVVFNRAGEELLGYDRKALLGKNNLDHFPPEQAAHFMAKDREALAAQGVVDIPEETIRTANRGERLLHTRKVCIRGADGKTKYLLGISEDITEHKRAETEIKNEQALSNAIIEGIPGTFYMLDEDGKYVRWSAYQRDEIVGKSDAEVSQTLAMDTIHPDDRALILSKIENVLRNDMQEVVEGRVLLRGGPAFVWLLMTGRRIILNGRPFLVGFGIDITERKHAEAEHAKLQMQFAQAQKMESVGRLAGGVAHDFNNLLMGIMNYTELCQDRIAPDHPIREYLDEIMHDSKRSAEIIRQLLAFARKQIIAPRVLDLNDAVAGMLKLLQRLVGEDITLAWRPGTSLRPVKLDPSQIDQILANLCVNARDAIAGVGEIAMETGSITVDAPYCARYPEAIPGAYVFLAVSDDGCGMDKETLAQAFEPFFTTKGLGKGTGLGLATVYGIVKQNNGFISATSEPGKGTTFRIHLPAIAAETMASTVTSKTAAPRGRGETILLVEDEKSLRVTCGAFLDALGYKVLVAETPGEALKLVAEQSGAIHVLLTDVVMPGMDGKQLARRIGAVRPGVKVLFISGYTADVVAQRGVLDEGVQFLAKPFSRDDLARKVREVLEWREDGQLEH
jgi:two-component system cell cycle sensor histidine kinase/response regulator CckA